MKKLNLTSQRKPEGKQIKSLCLIYFLHSESQQGLFYTTPDISLFKYSLFTPS